VFGGKSEATLARLASLEGVSYSPQAIVSPEAVLSPQDMEDTIEEAEMFHWANGANNVPTKVAASASKSLFKSSSKSIAQQEERKTKSSVTSSAEAVSAAEFARNLDMLHIISPDIDKAFKQHPNSQDAIDSLLALSDQRSQDAKKALDDKMERGVGVVTPLAVSDAMSTTDSTGVLEGVSYSPQAIVSPEAVLSPQDMEDTIEEAEMFRWENGANNVPTKVAASASKSLFKSSSESIAPQEERKRKTERTYEVYEEKVRVSANELVLAISFTLLSSNTNILYSDV
jgi:hypothetical protein